MNDLKLRLAASVERLLMKRLDRLEARKFVLFPWLRRRMLMHKYHVAARLLGL